VVITDQKFLFGDSSMTGYVAGNCGCLFGFETNNKTGLFEAL
jgi:hypothetical protein